jgi:hypothetical protein
VFLTIGISANCAIYGKWVVGILTLNQLDSGFFAGTLYSGGLLLPPSGHHLMFKLNQGPDRNNGVTLVNAFLTMTTR